MSLDLNGLEELGENFVPSRMDIIYYLFWERGISLEQVNKLPIPYILSVVRTHNHFRLKK